MSATVQPQTGWCTITRCIARARRATLSRTEPSEATPLQDTTNVRCLKTPKHHHSPTTSQHTPLMPGVRAPAPTPVGGAAPARLLKPSDLQLGTTPTQLPTTTPGVRKIQSQLSQLDRTPHPAQFLQGTKERQGHVRQVLRAQVHGADGVCRLHHTLTCNTNQRAYAGYARGALAAARHRRPNRADAAGCSCGIPTRC